MLDVTSLVWIAGLFLGLIVGDAAYFGDPMRVQISIPAKLADTGFTEATAEQVFEAEVMTIGQAPSLVPTPNIKFNSRPSLAAAIARPLNLDQVVRSLQSYLGQDITAINGSVLVDDKSSRLSMVMVVIEPRQVPAQITLTQEDGDATALIQRATNLVLERVAPYRVALTQFARGLQGDKEALEHARGTASRGVGQPWVASRSSERVMLFNLLGLLAVLDGDVVAAEKMFQLSDMVPSAAPEAQGIVALNRAFLALAAKQPEAAKRWLDQGEEQTANVDLPGWQTRLTMLSALVAWSAGDIDRAEEVLRQAVAEWPDDEGPHFYLAQVLAAKGDAAGAAQERLAAISRHQFAVRVPSLALSDFWVDVVKGGLTRRG